MVIELYFELEETVFEFVYIIACKKYAKQSSNIIKTLLKLGLNKV